MKDKAILKCEGCGRKYDREPALEVECPTCHAAAGRPCVVRRPSGHVHSAGFGRLPDWGHNARELQASIEGAYGCSCGISREEAQQRLDLVLRGKPLIMKVYAPDQIAFF